MTMMLPWLAQSRRNREVRRLIADRRFLNLGASEPPWPGFVTCGLATGIVEIEHDATTPYPSPMKGHFEFIWSERMLEHIRCELFPSLFAELKLIMRPEGRTRFCLPICFFGTPTVNMVREGNAERCAGFGHVSWFTYEGFGPVTPEVFGRSTPPNQRMRWEDLLQPLGLRYISIRHYDSSGNLFLDANVLRDETKHPFTDRPEIVLLRPDSIIFDIVHA